MSTFQKEVSGCEKFFIAYNEIRPPFVIQLVLEGIGEPSGEVLDDALQRATAANPGSSLRLDESESTPKWTLGPAPTLTLVDAPEFEGYGGENAPFLLWHLDAGKGPTCELVFVRGKNKSYLVFRALHAVMDGQGTILWVKEFMRCLRGEPPEGHRSPLSVDQLLRELKAEKRATPEADALHPYGPAQPATKGAFIWRRVHARRPLDAAMSGRIAVALAERTRRHGEGTVRVNLPTDLRHYRPHERTTGNLFNLLFVEVPPGASPDMVGLKVVQMLYKNEGAKPFGTYASEDVGSLAIHRVKVFRDLAKLHEKGRYAFSATLSHLGTLRSAELSAPSFETQSAYFVPLIGDSGCVIALNGFDDHTEACAGLSDRFSEGGRMEDLVSLIHTALHGTEKA